MLFEFSVPFNCLKENILIKQINIWETGISLYHHTGLQQCFWVPDRSFKILRRLNYFQDFFLKKIAIATIELFYLFNLFIKFMCHSSHCWSVPEFCELTHYILTEFHMFLCFSSPSTNYPLIRLSLLYHSKTQERWQETGRMKGVIVIISPAAR